ncbi:hypothetical protein AYO40_00605 [Planctomycetaceae bacterium SCGC AG-212-D15]|nr:hypothetical protein AYO40_00605 [Planctomycetaceae bacterium SCGC AG-212-D15]
MNTRIANVLLVVMLLRASDATLVAAPLDEWSTHGHKDYVPKVVFTHDGTTVASCSHDGFVKLWDRKTGELKQTFKGGSPVWRIAVSPDGSLLASGTKDGLVKLWEIGSGKELAVLQGHKTAVTSLAFSPDGATLASGGGHPDGNAILWDVKKRERRRALKESPEILDFAFSPKDKKTLIGGGLGYDIGVWDISTGERTKTIKDGVLSIRTVCFSADGATVISVDHRNIAIRDSKELTRQATISDAHEEMRDAALTADGKLIASVGAYDVKERKGVGLGELKLWDVKTSTLLTRKKMGREPCTSVAFAPDGKALIIGNYQGDVELLDVEKLLKEK